MSTPEFRGPGTNAMNAVSASISMKVIDALDKDQSLQDFESMIAGRAREAWRVVTRQLPEYTYLDDRKFVSILLAAAKEEAESGLQTEEGFALALAAQASGAYHLAHLEEHDVPPPGFIACERVHMNQRIIEICTRQGKIATLSLPGRQWKV